MSLGGWAYETRRSARQKKKAAFNALREGITPLVQQGDELSLERARQLTERYRRENAEKPEPPAFMRKIGEMARKGLQQKLDAQRQEAMNATGGKKRPGVPAGVAEAFPEEAAGRKVYDSPDPLGQKFAQTGAGGFLKEIGAMVLNAGRPGVGAVNAALQGDNPIGGAFREMGDVYDANGNPLPKYSALDNPGINRLPDKGIEVGPVNITPKTVAGFGLESAADWTSYVDLPVGQAVGGAAGKLFQRGGADAAQQVAKTPISRVGTVGFQASKVLDPTIAVDEFAVVSDRFLSALTPNEESALIDYVGLKDGVDRLRADPGTIAALSAKAGGFRSWLRSLSDDGGRTIRAYRFESGEVDTNGLESWALSPKKPRAFSNLYSGGKSPITVADIDIDSIVAPGAADDFEILVNTAGGAQQVAKPTFLESLGQKVAPAVAGGASPLTPSAVKAPAGSALGAAAKQAGAQGPKATLPAGIARALDQARNVTKADTPGAFAQAFYRIPGTKRLLRPGLDMPENVVEAYVGEGAARAEFSQQAFASRRPLFNQLDSAFGQGASEGGSIGVRFLGSSAEAQYPGTGTLFDILQRPEKYDLTPAQRTLVDSLDKRNDGLRVQAVEDFGADIGQFQRDAGGAYLPNVDRSEAAQDIAEAVGQSERSVVTSGRAKTRFYDTGYDRWRADMDAVAKGRLKPEQVFTPETNVRSLIEGMDSSKERMIGSQVFRAGLGGKTKLEVLEETHPELYQRMIGLRTRLETLRGTAGRLDEKLDATIEGFLNSPMNDADVDSLLANIEPQSVRGSVAGMTERQVRGEIKRVRNEIAQLNPAWKAANPRGYQFVADGIYRYFPADQVGDIKTLLKTDSSPIFRTLANINAGVLSGDLSPLVGQQGQVAWLTAPVQTSKAVFGGLLKGARQGDVLRGFRADALADDISKDATSWGDFAFYTGRSTTPGSVPDEFAGGWIGKVPGVGRKFTDANDAVYTAVIRAQKGMWDDQVDDLVKRGVDPQRARAIAGRSVMGIIPTPNSRAAGLSVSQAQGLRTPFTSLTFIQRPAQVISEATEGMANLAIPGRSMTEAQRLAVKSVVRMNATALSLAASTAAIYAEASGQDPVQAALDAVNPNDSHFMTVTLPGGATIPLGGPYRAIFRAISPRPVKVAGGDEVWLPFAGTYDFLKNRVSPALRRPIDLLRNKDFYGTPIMTADFPLNVLQAAEYQAEGMIPLSAGAVVEGVRKGADVGEIATSAAGNIAGTSVRLPSASDRLDEAAQRAYGRGFYDLSLEERGTLLRGNPDLAKRLSEDKSKRATDTGAYERAKVASRERVAALNDQLVSGALTREQWRDAIDTETKMLRGEARQLFGVDRDPPSEQEQARDPAMRYLAIMNEFTDAKTGLVNEAAIDAAVRERMTPAQIEAAFRGFGADDQPLQKLRSKAAREYYAIPRYQGMTAEQGQEIDRAWDQVLAIAGNTDNRLKKLQAIRKVGVTDPRVKQALYRRVYGHGLKIDPRRERWAKAHPEARPLLGLGRGVVTDEERKALASALGRA